MAATEQGDQLCPFIDVPLGKVLFTATTRKLLAMGLPQTSEDGISVAAFTDSARDILIPMSKRTVATSPEFLRARTELDGMADIFSGSIVSEKPKEPEPRAEVARDGRMSLSFDGGHGQAQVSFAGNGDSGSPPPSPSDDRLATSGAASSTGSKRARLGMSESDLSRACTAVNVIPNARVTPQFLVDKPLDVRLYTPLLVDLYSSVRKVNEEISRLASEVYEFEGDFLDLSSPAAAALSTTPLVASLDTTGGSRFFHKLDLLREAAVTLKAKNLRTQRAFWLANHTPGCNWDTWDQLVYREEQDAGADICNPGFTPLVTWEDQVKAAIVGARQEAAGLSKDGKSLLGPVLPRLLAKHGQGRGGTDQRGGNGWRGNGNGYKGSNGGTDNKPPGAARFARRTPKQTKKPAGKENRSTNAGANAPPKPTAKAAET